MERVVNFLKEAETYYLATVEGEQPRVRPFGTAHVFILNHKVIFDYLFKSSYMPV